MAKASWSFIPPTDLYLLVNKKREVLSAYRAYEDAAKNKGIKSTKDTPLYIVPWSSDEPGHIRSPFP